MSTTAPAATSYSVNRLTIDVPASLEEFRQQYEQAVPPIPAAIAILLRTDHLVIDDLRAGHHGAGSLLKQVVEGLALRLTKGAEHFVLD